MSAVETIERVIMNNKTGAIGLGIAVKFFEKYQSEPLAAMDGYAITLERQEPDGWLIFSGENEARGPWIFCDIDIVRDHMEVLGPL